MPWKETSVMDERLRFVAEVLRGEEPMTVLCERFGICRETGHKWKRRYLDLGPAGLMERSRAPLHHGRTTPDEVATPIITLRRERPHWGARKLLAVLARRHPEVAWPAPSTATDILRRAGLIESRRRRRKPIPRRSNQTPSGVYGAVRYHRPRASRLSRDGSALRTGHSDCESAAP